MTNNGRILVVGDVIDDIIVKPGREIRQNTDTPAIIERHPGGSSANTAAWLGHIGAHVHFFGRLGVADVERHRIELEKFSVETHLSGDETNPTGTIVIIVEGEDRTMLTDRGANVIFDLDTIPNELIADADFLHFTGHTVIDEPKRAAVTRIIKRAKQHGLTISFDPATAGFIEDFGVEDFLHLCEGVDILRPNEDEARILSGKDDPLAASAYLTERFPLVVTTCGKDGVYVAERGKEIQFFTVAPVKVVDPTGAGDSFNAGLLDGLARGLTPLDAAKHAAVVASEGLTRFGARPS